MTQLSVDAFVVMLVRSSAAPNKRLKLSARADYGMSLSPARRTLSAIR
jgi:hypothetical protein